MPKDKRTLLCVRMTKHCPVLDSQLDSAAPGWRVFHAENLAEARSLAQRYQPTVGLMVFGGASLDNVAEEVEQFLVNEKHTEWVGLVQPSEVNDPKLREFIVQYLYDFHSLPIDIDRLGNSIGHAHGMAGIRRSCFPAGPKSINEFGMIGAGQAMSDVFTRIDKIAGADVSVAICGASGTGKELAARAVHQRSPRADKPFIAVELCGDSGLAHSVGTVWPRERRLYRRAQAPDRSLRSRRRRDNFSRRDRRSAFRSAGDAAAVLAGADH